MTMTIGERGLWRTAPVSQAVTRKRKKKKKSDSPHHLFDDGHDHAHAVDQQAPQHDTWTNQKIKTKKTRKSAPLLWRPSTPPA
ncbi:hypothetical protein pqer_cds_17 [Pandoravirus quercus]|uniref:Uncharacterized protein n=1 Tax=Pandoravirus quercus TaxID=2107709 RepID=A0A2U7U7P0_9VIRU|nr:hypothetical protein pqer_cds_17 [Pandoravirus quercus]AVK74439.1 hypothetical protein pqer_cds_17 [Pandoravirus quercus]